MNCLEFRRIRLSDPYTADDPVVAHRGECAACRAFEAEIRTLDRKIARAFAVEVPECLAARILLNHSLKSSQHGTPRWAWYAMAASFLLAAVLATFWVSGRPAPEQQIARHLDMEQPMIDSILMPIHEPQIRQVLNSVNLDAAGSLGDLGNVVFASTCIIDGELVAHLVIRDADNRYTLLLAPTRMTEEEREFEGDHWRGVIAASASGAGVAVMAPAGANLDLGSMKDVLRKVNQAITPLRASPLGADTVRA